VRAKPVRPFEENHVAEGIDPADSSAVRFALNHWLDSSRDVAQYLHDNPGEREALTRTVFGKVKAAEGRVVNFDYANGRYTDLVDQKDYEKFRREMPNLYLGDYLAHVMDLMKAVSKTPVVGPAVAAPGAAAVPAAPGVFKGTDPVWTDPVDREKAEDHRKEAADLSEEAGKKDVRRKMASAEVEDRHYRTINFKPVTDEQTETSSVVARPFGREGDRSVFTLDVWNPEKKKYERHRVTAREFAALFAPEKRGDRMPIVTPKQREMMEQVSDPAGVQWTKRFGDVGAFPVRLEVRGHDGKVVFAGNPDQAMGPEMFLGIEAMLLCQLSGYIVVLKINDHRNLMGVGCPGLGIRSPVFGLRS